MERFEDVIDSKRNSVFYWKEVWQYRELFYFFSWRDIKIKYKQTVLGFLWVVLQPLLMMVVFTFFFGKALKVPSQNLPYPVFVFSGLLLWNFFAAGMTNASNGMVNNALIIKKIYFPRIIIPVSAVLVAFFDFIVAFVLFIFLLIFFKTPVSWSAVWCWPLGLLISIFATVGPGCLLGALNVKYRDFKYVIPFLVQLLFFTTPVIYPSALISHPVLQYVLAASPMYAPVELFRYPLTQILPDFTLISVSMLSSILFVLIGLIYFKKTQDFFADFA